MRKLISLFLFTFTVAAAWAPPVAAQTENDARMMLEEGNRYLEQAQRLGGRARQRALREALSHYHRALQITRSRSVIFNVALCYEMLGRYDDAFAYYTEYLGFEDLPPSDRAIAEERLEEIRPHVALVEVTSRPEGATIYVDRTDLPPRGVTPTTVAIPAGPHRIILELEHYESADQQVDAALGQTREVHFDLAALPAQVRFETDPPGAEIRLDDENAPPLGTTPLTTSVPAGSHRVYATLEDRSGREVFDAPPGGSITVPVVLGAPTTPGFVDLNVDAPAAEVTVDGQEVGNAPIRRLRLTPGRHRITVDAGTEHEIWSDVVEVTPGARFTMDVHLAPAEPRRRFGPWPNVGLVLAGMLMVASAATGGWAWSLYTDFQEIEDLCNEDRDGDPQRCATGTALRDDAIDLRDRIRPLAIATDVLWISAVVLGLTSMTLAIFNREIVDSTTVTIGAAPTPGGAMATVGFGPMVLLSP